MNREPCIDDLIAASCGRPESVQPAWMVSGDGQEWIQFVVAPAHEVIVACTTQDAPLEEPAGCGG